MKYCSIANSGLDLEWGAEARLSLDTHLGIPLNWCWAPPSSQQQVDIKPASSLVTSQTKCGTIMANMGRSTEHLVRHMGEFSLFVPLVGVFIFIIILLVCMCKGKKGKTTSDIESKVMAGSKLKLLEANWHLDFRDQLKHNCTFYLHLSTWWNSLTSMFTGLQPSVFMKGASCSNCMMVEVRTETNIYYLYFRFIIYVNNTFASFAFLLNLGALSISFMKFISCAQMVTEPLRTLGKKSTKGVNTNMDKSFYTT